MAAVLDYNFSLCVPQPFEALLVIFQHLADLFQRLSNEFVLARSATEKTVAATSAVAQLLVSSMPTLHRRILRQTDMEPQKGLFKKDCNP